MLLLPILLFLNKLCFAAVSFIFELNRPTVKCVDHDLNYKVFRVTNAMSPLGGHLEVLQVRAPKH